MPIVRFLTDLVANLAALAATGWLSALSTITLASQLMTGVRSASSVNPWVPVFLVSTIGFFVLLVSFVRRLHAAWAARRMDGESYAGLGNGLTCNVCGGPAVVSPTASGKRLHGSCSRCGQPLFFSQVVGQVFGPSLGRILVVGAAVWGSIALAVCLSALG